MRVTVDEFLTRVAALYDAPHAPNRKATIAISCRSVPTARVFPKDAQAATRDATVLLFRATKYGNNHHKTKYSVVISPSAQAAFHSQLSHIVKIKAERKHHSGIPPTPSGSAKRSGKKTTE